MKGLVFTEFLEMVEERFGYDIVDQILTTSDLPSGGIYAAVGTYNHSEMITLVEQVSQRTNQSVPELLRSYGQYMFNIFTRSYRQLLDRSDSAFSLFHFIQEYHSVEVRKLYPDAELPHFSVEQPAPDHLTMHYTSERKLSDFAHGLIEGCLEHFGEQATVTKTDLTDDGSQVLFDIVKR
ncbi:heme NO-binding domain-containing protein [Rudanella lutea]|uniref:heme NO-binding domain-containing protein n=1 Tax=Rudanella lutea TaxID=451374 RepID=UPI000363A290|nr:heme NO-binding domain-containing protein [Rudanella lutea]